MGGQPVDATITLAVAMGARTDRDAVTRCQRAAAASEWAPFRPAQPPEHDELERLAVRRYDSGGTLPGEDARRLADLDSRAYRLAAYEGAELCGIDPG